MLNEINQTDREKQILYGITYMGNLKYKMSEYNKKESDLDRENKLVVTSGEREGGRGMTGVRD